MFLFAYRITLPAAAFVIVVCSESIKMAASEATHMWRRATIDAIPTWKLDMRYNPLGLQHERDSELQQGLEVPEGAFYLPVDAGKGGSLVGYSAGSDALGISFLPGKISLRSDSGAIHGLPPAYGTNTPRADRNLAGITSTADQDNGNCPLIRLDDFAFIEPKDADSLISLGQQGEWTTTNRMMQSSWSQNFWSRQWKNVYMRNFAGKLATKVRSISLEDLLQAYNWKVNMETLPDYTAQYGEPLNGSNPENLLAYMMTDCQDNLMFVALLEKVHPGGIDLYDRLGNLAAHGITDPVIARYQFVDPAGYLLGMAESPGLLMNVTRPDPTPKGQKGPILPYAMKFMEGGYPNASRLVDLEYRWALAAAIQARALADAYGEWQPLSSQSFIILAWSSLGFYIIMLMWCSSFLYQIVYPEAVKSNFNPFLKGVLYEPGKEKFFTSRFRTPASLTFAAAPTTYAATTSFAAAPVPGGSISEPCMSESFRP
jgi:hypothetical protein